MPGVSPTLWIYLGDSWVQGLVIRVYDGTTWNALALRVYTENGWEVMSSD